MTDLDIKSLLAEEQRLADRIKTVRGAIASLRALCDHEFVSAGNDSHYNYVRCTRCGHEESR
ncbi:MAG: hypothetical protein ABMA13_20580 [Chthoniobacteraceae bacterium]